MSDPRRWMVLLAACWLGMLMAVAALATPAPFALLARADAGRVVARILEQEAAISLVCGGLLMVLQRFETRRRVASGTASPQFDAVFGLSGGVLFCTVAGYYAIQPMMADARLGQGPLSFGQLHAISAAFYACKLVLVALLAWRLTRRRASSD